MSRTPLLKRVFSKALLDAGFQEHRGIFFRHGVDVTWEVEFVRTVTVGYDNVNVAIADELLDEPKPVDSVDLSFYLSMMFFGKDRDLWNALRPEVPMDLEEREQLLERAAQRLLEQIDRHPTFADLRASHRNGSLFLIASSKRMNAILAEGGSE